MCKKESKFIVKKNNVAGKLEYSLMSNSKSTSADFTKNQLFYLNQFMIAEDNYNFIIKAFVDLSKQQSSLLKKSMKKMRVDTTTLHNVLPKLNNKEYDVLLYLYPVLGLDCLDHYIGNGLEHSAKYLHKWLEDKNFRQFYKKVLLVMSIIKKGKVKVSFNNDVLADRTMLLYSIQGILWVYFIHNMKSISDEDIKSFFTSVFDWKTFNVNFSVAFNEEQKEMMRQIKTGIKYVVFKQDEEVSHKSLDTKSKEYNVIDDIKNSITIKYDSGLNNKHRYHKSPIMHYRNGTWRTCNSGKKVWVKGCWINE